MSIPPAHRDAARWYFDCLSPYAALQLPEIIALEARLDIEYVPVLLAGILKHHGQLGPAEIVPKRRQIYRQCLWQARQDGRRFRFPPRHPFNPLALQRLLVALGPTSEQVRTAFDFVFGEGRDPSDAAEWAVLCARLGADAADARIADPAIKQRLADNTAQALADGVFGVPTLTVRGETFWGWDSTPMLRAFLDDPALFADAEMQRLDALPIGVQRPR